MKIMQQQNVIEDLMIQIPPPYLFNEARPAPFPADTVLNQHLQSVEMSQNQDNNRPLQAIILNRHMNQKELLADHVTMEFQQK